MIVLGYSENIEMPAKLLLLEDQIAMESLDQHLKKITQLPGGFKHRVEADLLRKLTTVSPAPHGNTHCHATCHVSR